MQNLPVPLARQKIGQSSMHFIFSKIFASYILGTSNNDVIAVTEEADLSWKTINEDLKLSLDMKLFKWKI